MSCLKAKKKKRIRIFESMDEAYRYSLPRLISIAESHLYHKDEAIDVAHEAFEKALVYLDRNKLSVNNKRGVKISYFLLARAVLRLCRKHNKRVSVEVSYDFREQERQANFFADDLYAQSGKR